jgi:hypothetical protein
MGLNRNAKFHRQEPKYSHAPTNLPIVKPEPTAARLTVLVAIATVVVVVP